MIKTDNDEWMKRQSQWIVVCQKKPDSLVLPFYETHSITEFFFYNSYTITMTPSFHPESVLEWGSGVFEGFWLHSELSDVMLLVICSETRGEILLRCHCSVKLHTAGQISLTRHILWKSRNTVLFPTGLRNGWGNRKNTLYKWTTVSYFNSLTHRRINCHHNMNKDIRISCAVRLSNEQPSLFHLKEPHRVTIQKSMKHSS